MKGLARLWLSAGVLAALALAGCQTKPVPVKPPAPVPLVPAPAPPPPTPAPVARQGDEIIVAGHWFHIDTTVVTWMDPGGYDAYRPEPPANKPAKPHSTGKPSKTSAPATTKSYGVREVPGAAGKGQPVRRGDFATLQRVVDQFVLHYDGSGISSGCFSVLRQRGLSVHFLLDIDGTIYQTLDLEAKALHATTSNDRSIGIEIANVGAHAPADAKVLAEWYQRDAQGRTRLRMPKEVRDPLIRTKNFLGRPARDARVRGVVQGLTLEQYDFTPEQYAALSKLTAALCRVFPRITCDYPRDKAGQVIPQKLPDDVLAQYHGVLGHFHIQANKQDPGPAMQWDKLIDGAREAGK